MNQCEACSGDGYVFGSQAFKEKTCTYCNGTGKFVSELKLEILAVLVFFGNCHVDQIKTALELRGKEVSLYDINDELNQLIEMRRVRRIEGRIKYYSKIS